MGRMKLLDNVINAANNQVEGFCIVKSVAKKSNVKGADYLDFTLADASGEIAAKLWDYDASVHGEYAPDTIVKVRATVNMWKDAEQLKIDRIRPVREGDDAEIGELVPCAPEPAESMFSELHETAEHFSNKELRALTLYVLDQYKDKIMRFPAALKLHHAMRAGLMFHTVSMLRAAEGICDVYKSLYPSLNRELVYAGIILHDIAKTEEFAVGSLGLATAYSTPGQLLGHINMGVSIVDAAAHELDTSENVKLALEHILLSHHNLPEHGSPRYPMFPEAEIVSELDLLDSKLFEMYDALDAVSTGEFTERQWALDNRQLYKHGI